MRQLSKLSFNTPLMESYRLNESKKAKDIKVVFLSASAEKITKSSNSMFHFKEVCEAHGLTFIVIDPSAAKITKCDDNTYNVVEYAYDEKSYTISPLDTIIVPRRTVLKNSESRDFLSLLQGYGFFCFNTLDSFLNCEDKFTTYRVLKQNNVPTPRTAIITPSSLSKLQSKVDEVGGQFPLVCKILDGTQGVGVFLAESMMSLRSTLQTMFKISPKSDIIIQEKIDSEYDLRIHVMYEGFEKMSNDVNGFSVIGCMQRNKMDGDFRSNFSLGATAEKGYITPQQEEIAKKAAKATGCRWCGVDLIMDKRTGDSYVIEVNSSPGTKGITTAAGDDVVATIMQMFKDFKYTKYNSDSVGRFETGKVKDFDNKECVLFFNSADTITKLNVTTVNEDESGDNVSFTFNGGTYTLPSVGKKRDAILVELNMVFNGSVYKNELTELHIVSPGEKCGEYITVGSKFLGRLGTNVTIQPQLNFILTDNVTEFEIPAPEEDEIVMNESAELNESLEDEFKLKINYEKIAKALKKCNIRKHEIVIVDKTGKEKIIPGYVLDKQYHIITFIDLKRERVDEFLSTLVSLGVTNFKKIGLYSIVFGKKEKYEEPEKVEATNLKSDKEDETKED